MDGDLDEATSKPEICEKGLEKEKSDQPNEMTGEKKTPGAQQRRCSAWTGGGEGDELGGIIRVWECGKEKNPQRLEKSCFGGKEKKGAFGGLWRKKQRGLRHELTYEKDFDSRDKSVLKRSDLKQ